MKKHLLLLVAMLLGLIVSTSGCKDDTDLPLPGQASPRTTEDTNLVLTYKELRGIKPEESLSDYRSVVLQGVAGLPLWKSDEEGNPRPAESLTPYDSLYNRKGLYESMTELNGDTEFKEGVEHFREFFHNGYFQGAWLEDIIDVQVTAVTAYDALHPAGSSLSDMAYLSYNTIFPFIREGYRFNENSIGNGYHPAYLEYYADVEDISQGMTCMKTGDKELRHHIKISEIAANPLRIVSCDRLNPFVISFAGQPDGECAVKIAITVQLRGGEYPARILTATCNVK